MCTQISATVYSQALVYEQHCMNYTAQCPRFETTRKIQAKVLPFKFFYKELVRM